MEDQINKPILGSEAILIIFFVIIVATLLVIGIYLWQKTITEIQVAELQEKIESLEAQSGQEKGGKVFKEKEPTGQEEGTSSQTSLIRKDFSYPYPLSWTWKEEARMAEFSLTGVSLGKRTVSSFVRNPQYSTGEEINALTLYLKIKTSWENVGICLPTDFRLVLNEEGDLMAPINQQFNAGCPRGNRTYFDQEAIFVVPESQKEFTLTTGGKSNIFFTVIALESGDLKVEKSATSEQE